MNNKLRIYCIHTENNGYMVRAILLFHAHTITDIEYTTKGKRSQRANSLFLHKLGPVNSCRKLVITIYIKCLKKVEKYNFLE
jgi:hypothetical protein